MKICEYVKKLLCIGLITLLFCSQLFTVEVNAGRTIVDDTTEEIAIYNKEASHSVSSDKDYQILESNGFRYKILENETVAISGYYEGGTEIIIPERIEGKLVTRVDDKAFQGLEFVDTIVLPESLISIGDNAFSKCGNLISIEIPKTVTRMGESAFSECSKLASMAIPKNVTYIGNYAFWECRNLTSITMSDNVSFIGESAFSCCSSLADITIPNGIKTIGTCVFIGCSNLKDIIIPESVEIDRFYGMAFNKLNGTL